MSTRGCYGFYKEGINKLTYNHSDSYPSVLGEHIFKFILNNNNSKLDDIFSNIKMIKDKDGIPTSNEKSELELTWNEYFDKTKNLSWYKILSSTFGNLNYYSEGLTFMLDYNDFIKNSLHCQWAYILNLDSYELEIYVGFQTKPQCNRYYLNTPKSFNYYNCKLIYSFKFDVIRKSCSLEDLFDVSLYL